MRRVYGIWFLRQLAPTLVGMPVLLTVAFWQIAGDFFVSKIVENFIISLRSGNISVIMNFMVSALYNVKEHAVCISIVGLSVGLALILGYRLVRNFTRLTLVRI